MWFIRHSTQALNGSVYQIRRGFTMIRNDLKMPISVPNQRRHYQSDLEHEEKQQLMDVFPSIVHDIISDPNHRALPEVATSIKNMLQFTVPTGKRTRAMSLVRCYKSMENPKNLTPDNIKLAYILGWCIELLQGAANVVDDVVDNSETRRGGVCWYKREDVGSKVYAHAKLLTNYPYKVLDKYFSHLPMYIPAMQFIRETTLQLALGGLLDTTRVDPSKGLTINRFTREYFQISARYKTATFAVELPYNLARCLSNKLHIEIPAQTQEVLQKLGEFYQIQNDFLDCYDDSSIGLKTGNDIEEGRCTWLVVTALERATPAQRQVIETHYGKRDPRSVEIVKGLYDVLEIAKAYAVCEKAIFNLIEENSDLVSNIISHEMMFKRLDQLYRKYL